MRHGGIDHIAAGRVQHAFRLAGRAGGIENEKRVFGTHFFSRTIIVGFFFFLVIPDIAPVLHGHASAGALNNNYAGDIGALGQRCIGIGFQWNLFAAAHPFIGGNDAAAVAIENAPRQSVGREAAKHHGVHRANARASQHGISGLGYHRHINGDAVAFGDALRLQHIGKFANVFMQLTIGDFGVLVGFITLPNNRHLVAARLDMTVNAIDAGV